MAAACQKIQLSFSVQSLWLFFIIIIFLLTGVCCQGRRLRWTLWSCEYMFIKLEDWPLTRRLLCRELVGPEASDFRISERIKDPFWREKPESFLCLSFVINSLTHGIWIDWNVFLVAVNEMTYPPMDETQNSSLLTQMLFLMSVSQRNVLWELLSTSETEQEERGTLNPAAECLTCIRSTKDSQTKTVLFVWRGGQEFCSIPLPDSHYMISLFDSSSLCILHVTWAEKKRKILKNGVILKIEVTVLLCLEQQQTYGEKLVQPPPCARSATVRPW